MAVIEMSLGLTGNMSGLLGNRKTLIVEGGDDALILNKLSSVLRAGGKECLSDSIYRIGHKMQRVDLLTQDAFGGLVTLIDNTSNF